MLLKDSREGICHDPLRADGVTYYYAVYARGEEECSGLLHLGSVCSLPEVRITAYRAAGTVCQITWERPENCLCVRVLRQTGAIPQNITDGGIRAHDALDGYEDGGLQEGQTYGYRLQAGYDVSGEVMYSEGRGFLVTAWEAPTEREIFFLHNGNRPFGFRAYTEDRRSLDEVTLYASETSDAMRRSDLLERFTPVGGVEQVSCTQDEIGLSFVASLDRQYITPVWGKGQLVRVGKTKRLTLFPAFERVRGKVEGTMYSLLLQWPGEAVAALVCEGWQAPVLWPGREGTRETLIPRACEEPCKQSVHPFVRGYQYVSVFAVYSCQGAHYLSEPKMLELVEEEPPKPRHPAWILLDRLMGNEIEEEGI